MKILLDSCVWGKAQHEIRSAGHDVVWAGSWDRDPGDAVILEIARSESRVLVTLDKDFGELAILRGVPHAGIIRLLDFSARTQAGVCLEVLARYEHELALGALVTVRADRVRIRLN